MVKTLSCHCKGAWVLSLIRKLRSHMPCGVTKKKKKKMTTKKPQHLIITSLQGRHYSPYFSDKKTEAQKA